MRWPRYRRKQRVIPAFGEIPSDIKVDQSEYELLIINILEYAQAKAKALGPGAEFTVRVEDKDIPRDVHPAAVVLPVMMRAQDYGLMPGICFDWDFTFTKL